MPQRCDTVQEIVQDGPCSCECVTTVAEIPSDAGPRTRMRLMAATCPSCNNTCNSMVQSKLHLTASYLHCGIVVVAKERAFLKAQQDVYL